MDKLEKLNELEVIDSSCFNGECEYVIIKNSEENREALKELGADESDIESMDVDGEGETLDITLFAFESLGAEWFSDNGGFSYTESD